MKPDNLMNPFCMPLRRKRSLAVRLTLLRGVLRRLYLNLLRPRYVRESLARRQGMCLRCGACCYLVANRCARLIIDPDSGQTSC